MSSILEALRKLERDKAARGERQTALARDILLGGGSRRRQALWPLLLVIGLAGTAIWGGIAYFQRAPHLVAETVVEADIRPVQEQLAPVSPPTPEPEIETEVLLQTRAVGFSEIAAATSARSRSSAPTMREEKALPADPEPMPAPAGSSAPAASPPAVITPSVPWRLSGIAFQEEAGASLAILNDLPVMEGTYLEGARVEAILADRVRLSEGGRVFEVLLER